MHDHSSPAALVDSIPEEAKSETEPASPGRENGRSHSDHLTERQQRYLQAIRQDAPTDPWHTPDSLADELGHLDDVDGAAAPMATCRQSLVLAAATTALQQEGASSSQEQQDAVLQAAFKHALRADAVRMNLFMLDYIREQNPNADQLILEQAALAKPKL
ncbi:MAG: hypothetical protein AAF515_15955 [Pseudomonadota bacterium]